MGSVECKDDHLWPLPTVVSVFSLMNKKKLTLCNIRQCNPFEKKENYQLDGCPFGLADAHKLFGRECFPMSWVNKGIG